MKSVTKGSVFAVLEENRYRFL